MRITVVKKADILKSKGIKIRKVNKDDKACARTDYQRQANYMITTSNGKQFYSKNGSLRDALGCEKYATSKRTTKPVSKSTTRKPTTRKTTRITKKK